MSFHKGFNIYKFIWKIFTTAFLISFMLALALFAATLVGMAFTLLVVIFAVLKSLI